MTSSQNPYQVTTTDSLKVCDTRYYCIKHGEHKLQWTTTKPSENERAVGCLVDVLHAHATAYGCVNSIKGSKPACTQTRPCLSNGVDDMIHCLEPTTDAHLPDLLAADQKCVLSDYDHKTDSVERYMRLGTDGGDIAIMRKNDPLLVDAAPHAAPHAVSPAAAAAVAAASVAATAHSTALATTRMDLGHHRAGRMHSSPCGHRHQPPCERAWHNVVSCQKDHNHDDGS